MSNERDHSDEKAFSKRNKDSILALIFPLLYQDKREYKLTSKRIIEAICFSFSKNTFQGKRALSDYKKVLITKNYPRTITVVEVVDYKESSNKWWDNIFVVRHIVLSKHDQFNPYDFRNFKRVTTLPYYNDLFEILSEKIKTPHNIELN